MPAVDRRRAFRVWATLVYWTGQAAGVLVVECRGRPDGRYEFVAAGGQRWRLAWNAVCLAAVVYRIAEETWPVTERAARAAHATCYDTVCGGVWCVYACVYACVYYAVAWLDRTAEIGALLAAATWRRRSTAECLNSAVAECCSVNVNDDRDSRRPTVTDVPWHAYLTVALPVVHFAAVANAISPSRNGGRAWKVAMATVATVASCAPVAAHGTAVALLVVANNSMRSINHRVATRLSRTGRSRRRRRNGGDRENDDRRRRTVVARLAREHWTTTELVTGGVCGAYGADLVAAVLLAAVRVTYVAVSVFRRLTDDDTASYPSSRTGVSLLVIVVQLTAWFGQFAYLAYTCDELTAQVCRVVYNRKS